MRLPSHFYAIIDPVAGHAPVELARILLENGARIVQLRLKQTGSRAFLEAAEAVADEAHKCGALFIVNDRADIAMLSGADGVHLGQDDLPLEAARRLLGAGKVIGISTHSIEQAREAEKGGADYVGFGPIYEGGLKNIKTGLGLASLRALRAAVRIPIVAIGGITEATLPDVLEAGADAAAIITDVVFAPDVGRKTRAILSLAPR